MQLTSTRLDWTLPRTWFVTARLLEVAAATAIAASAYQSWLVFQTTTQTFGPNGELLPDGPPFLDRVALFAMYGFGFGQSTSAALIACVLLLAALAVLHLAQPVGHAALLRWEVFAVWLAAAVFNLCMVLASAVGLFRGDPNAPETDTEVFNTGPTPTEQVLGGLAMPVICLLLLGLSAIWWLRLPEDFDELDDERDDKRDGGADTGTDAGTDAGPDTGRDSERMRGSRRWRPAPAQDANVDDITLEGVELIEPVERLHPREGGRSGDGSTASGYDDYFRRF